MKTLRKLGALCVTLLVAGSMFTTAAEASHFRFGSIECEPTGNPGEIECTITQAWRLSAFFSTPPSPGDVSSTTSSLNWGDGSSTEAITLVVTQVSAAQDWFIGERTFTHTYSSSGTYDVGFANCCRIGGLGNTGSSFRVFATLVVDANAAPAISSNPQSSIAPIVGVPQSATVGDPETFVIPRTDPDGDPTQCRLASASEAGGGALPTGLTVKSDCTVEWDNAGLDPGLFWTQVIIEELDGSGNVVQTTPLDFLLNLGGQGANSAPACEITDAGGNPVTGGSVTATVGNSLSFTVEGTDLDGDDVEIAGVTVPTWGSMSPTLPVIGAPPITSTFTGTPASGELGTEFATFSLVDTNGAQTQCSLQIDVTQPPTSDGDLLLTSICTDGDGSLFRVRNEGSTDAAFSADNAAGTFNLSGTALAGADQFFYAPSGSTVRLYDADGNQVDVKAHNPASCVDENNPPVCEGEISPSDRFASFDVASPYRGLEEIEITVTNGTVEVFDENGESTGFSVTDDTDTFDAGEVFGQSYTLNLQGNFNGNVAFFATASGPNGSVECDPRFSNVDQEEPNGTVSFAVHNNAPNPFSESTTLHYDLPEAADVSVEVYDAMGRQVETVALGQQTAGANQQVRLQARNWPAGVYLYRLTATGSTTHVASGQMTLVR